MSAMSRRSKMSWDVVGFSLGSSESKVSFDKLFTRENLTVEQVLDTPSIVEEVRMNSDSFSRYLKVRPDLVQELMDYAVCPELQQQKKGNFPVKYVLRPLSYPFIAIELLCGQNEQFLDFSLGVKNEVMPAITIDDKQSLKFEESKSKANFDIPLAHMFRFLETSERINETAAGYLLRFISQLQYQKGSELFQFFEAHSHITTKLIYHSYNKSMTDVFSKLFSVGANEFTEQKNALINMIFASLETELRDRELSERLQNFIFMLEDLAEKCQDRYDGTRFITLMNKIISPKNVQILADILLKNADDDQILLPGLDIMTVFLTFYKTQKLKQARKNDDEDNEQKVDNNTMVVEQVEKSSMIDKDVLLIVETLTNKLLHKFEGKELNINWAKEEQSIFSYINVEPQMISERFVLTPNKQKKEEDTLSELTTIITDSKPQFAEEEQVDLRKPYTRTETQSESLLFEETSPLKPKFKFSQLKLFLIVQDLIILEPKSSNFGEDLLTVPFVRYAIKLMEKHPQNNLMHNTLKNIMVRGITDKTHIAHIICSKRTGLVKFIIDTSTKEPKSDYCYTNQLHHISGAIESARHKDSKLACLITEECNIILDLDPTWQSYINGAYAEIIKAHTRLLGGEDPKKRSDICMSGLYNCINKSATAKASKEEAEDTKCIPNDEMNEISGMERMGEIDEGDDEPFTFDINKDKEPKESLDQGRRGTPLFTFLRDQVQSEEQTTPISMEIETFDQPITFANFQKREESAAFQEIQALVKQTLTDGRTALISDALQSTTETQKHQQL